MGEQLPFDDSGSDHDDVVVYNPSQSKPERWWLYEVLLNGEVVQHVEHASRARRMVRVRVLVDGYYNLLKPNFKDLTGQVTIRRKNNGQDRQS